MYHSSNASVRGASFKVRLEKYQAAAKKASKKSCGQAIKIPKEKVQRYNWYRLAMCACPATTDEG
jgi:hypothetical protein